MSPDCLAHVLTQDELDRFNAEGYLVVEDAVDDTTRNTLIAAMDRIDQEERSPEKPHQLLSVTNILPRDERLLNLVDNPRVFPKVWGILGWNIYSYHTHLDVTPPAEQRTATWRVAWHQDSMRVNDEIECSPRPRLSLKVGYYLSDVSQPGRGNTMIVPGSHLLDEIDCPEDGQSDPLGAIPLCVPPGSAVIIDRRIWHSRSLNESDLTRKVLWYGYSYRWLKPKDAMTVEHLYPQCDPIRRQLLGDGLSANGVYDPQDGDVPLRGWLAEHRPDDVTHSLRGRRQSRTPAMVRGRNSGRE